MFSVGEDQLSNGRGKLIKSLTNKVLLYQVLTSLVDLYRPLPLIIAIISYFSMIIVAIALTRHLCFEISWP